METWVDVCDRLDRLLVRLQATDRRSSDAATLDAADCMRPTLPAFLQFPPSCFPSRNVAMSPLMEAHDEDVERNIE